MPPRREIPLPGATNPEMAMMAQAMATMAAAFAEQNNAKAERDRQKQQREERAAETKGLSEFRRYEPPKFHGDPDPVKADLWLQEIEKIFEVLHTPNEVKLTYASYLLSGDAEYWWRGTRQMMIAAGHEVNWESFRRKFLDKYFPQSARDQMEEEYLKIRQGSLTIGEYAAKFETLARYFRFFQHNVDEEYMCVRFTKGLRYEILESVKPLGIHGFQPLVEKCREVEEMKNSRYGKTQVGGPSRSNQSGQGQQGKQMQRKPYSRPPGNNRNQNRPMTQAFEGSSQRLFYCFKCGSKDHFADKCPSKEKLCFTCKKPSHISKDCPGPKVETFANTTRAARPSAQGRVYNINSKDTPKDLVQGTGDIAGNTLSLLFDCGATHSFIDKKCERG